jgi:asparagine synthetase B (glutamine-hydrolysing)
LNIKKAFIARDRIGIKPLYYSYDSSRLFIASEVKSFLKHLDISAAPDWDGINGYFFRFCLGEKHFMEIKKIYQVILSFLSPLKTKKQAIKKNPLWNNFMNVF